MADSNSATEVGRIVESSILSFAPNVDLEASEDILRVVRFAHAAAKDERDQSLNPDWFINFRRKLSFLGWDATPPPIVTNIGEGREVTLKSALEQIARVGTSEHLDATGRTVCSLRLNPQVMEALTFKMKEESGTKLQLMPCARHSGDYYDMVLLNVEMLSKEISANLNFLKGESKLPLSKMSAELIRFNLRLYRDQFKRKVEARVDSLNDQTIASLGPIAGSP